VLPFWTSYVIRSYSWLLVLSENGVLNQALLGIGLIESPIGFGNTRGATVLGFVHFFAMLLTLTIYANLVQIKDSYRRAAADLGASDLQVFLRITLPLSLPGVAVGAFLTFVLAIGDYITPQILGGSKELLLPQAIMLQVGRTADFALASALSMILMAVVTIAFLLFARRLRMDRV
jgi:spermidine/putrescine transport system permease protein